MKTIKPTTGPFAGKTIVIGAQDRIEQYPEQCRRILEAIGHPEAWVSDISEVADFELDDDELAAAGAALGFPVSHDDFLVDLAELMARPVQ